MRRGGEESLRSEPTRAATRIPSKLKALCYPWVQVALLPRFRPPMPSSLPELIAADLFRYTGQLGRRAFWRAYLHDPGFQFTYHLRQVAHYAPRRRSAGLLPYLWHRARLHRCRFRFGFDLSPTTAIGPGLYIGHFGGVVVSPAAVLGANCNLAQGVTIGATSRGSKIGAPVLGDRVWVGANAVLVGRIRVGSDALIAPGAYVNFDVPEHVVVLGNPGKIVAETGSAGYVNRVLERSSHRPAEPA